MCSRIVRKRTGVTETIFKEELEENFPKVKREVKWGYQVNLMGIQETNSETDALMKPLYFKDKE